MDKEKEEFQEIGLSCILIFLIILFLYCVIQQNKTGFSNKPYVKQLANQLEGNPLLTNDNLSKFQKAQFRLIQGNIQNR